MASGAEVLSPRSPRSTRSIKSPRESRINIADFNLNNPIQGNINRINSPPMSPRNRRAASPIQNILEDNDPVEGEEPEEPIEEENIEENEEPIEEKTKVPSEPLNLSPRNVIKPVLPVQEQPFVPKIPAPKTTSKIPPKQVPKVPQTPTQVPKQVSPSNVTKIEEAALRATDIVMRAKYKSGSPMSLPLGGDNATLYAVQDSLGELVPVNVDAIYNKDRIPHNAIEFPTEIYRPVSKQLPSLARKPLPKVSSTQAVRPAISGPPVKQPAPPVLKPQPKAKGPVILPVPVPKAKPLPKIAPKQELGPLSPRAQKIPPQTPLPKAKAQQLPKLPAQTTPTLKQLPKQTPKQPVLSAIKLPSAPTTRINPALVLPPELSPSGVGIGTEGEEETELEEKTKSAPKKQLLDEIIRAGGRSKVGYSAVDLKDFARKYGLKVKGTSKTDYAKALLPYAQ